jgi:hypothetical protein
MPRGRGAPGGPGTAAVETLPPVFSAMLFAEATHLSIGLYPIVTLEKQRRNMIGNLA